MSEYNDIINSILSAIDIMIEKKMNNIKKDYTVVGILKSVSDNICVVTIDGEDCNCKCVDKLELSIGDIVNVKVPKSDFSKKYIESKLGTPTII